MTNFNQCKAFDASGTIRCELDTWEDEEHHQPKLHKGTNIDETEVFWGGQHFPTDPEEGLDMALPSLIRTDFDPENAETWLRSADNPQLRIQRTSRMTDVIVTIVEEDREEMEFYLEEWTCTKRTKVNVTAKGKMSEVRE